MPRVPTICVVWGLLAAPGVAHAQRAAELQVPTAGNQVRTSIDRAAQFLEQQQYEEAIDLLVRLVENAGDELTPRPGGGPAPSWIPVRLRCQQLLCEMGAAGGEGLAAYRRRVDPLARQWFEAGRRDADAAPLERIGQDLLASSVGDDALLLLGDLSMQQGQFAVARHAWQRISPQLTIPPSPPAWLAAEAGEPLWRAVAAANTDERWAELEASLAAARPAGRAICPQTDLPLPLVRARLAAASILAGDLQRAEAEIVLLERLHPGAEGVLAGKSGPLAPALRQLLVDSRSWSPEHVSSDWPMLGKEPDRAGRAPRAVDVGPVLWSAELQRLEAPGERLLATQRLPGESKRDLLSYHVAASRGAVAIHEPHRIRVLDLQTGAPRFSGDTGEVWRAPPWRLEQPLYPDRPYAGLARFRVAIDRHRLLARTGPLTTSSTSADEVRGAQLLAIDLTRQGRLMRGFPIACEPTDPQDDPAGWSFENAPPLASEGRLYAGVRWNDGVRTTLSIDCYDLATGERRWRTRLCGGRTWAQLAQTPEDPPWDELSGVTLSMADGMLYCCTTLGVVAAVDADSGRRLWATAYGRDAPSPRGRHGHALRDATPCLIHGRWVIAAPQDSASLVALDRFTGELLWQTAGELTEDVVHLLGAEGDFLICSGDRLSWVQLRDGEVACRFPAGGSASSVRAAPKPRGHGRGLLAGDTVLWPTERRLLSFRTRPVLLDGRWQAVGLGAETDLSLRGARGGNLAWADDVLLIAAADRLFALAAPPITTAAGQLTESER